MKNQNTKAISPEEQAEIDKINLKESGVKETDTKEKDSDNDETPEKKSPKKQKHTGTVVQEGLTDGQGNFYPMDKGDELPEQYKESHKDWKKYSKYSDGSIEM